jgi:hypothetical protein
MKDRTQLHFDSATEKYIYMRSLQAFDEARKIFGLPSLKAPKQKLVPPLCLTDIPSKKDHE